MMIDTARHGWLRVGLCCVALVLVASACARESDRVEVARPVPDVVGPPIEPPAPGPLEPDPDPTVDGEPGDELDALRADLADARSRWTDAGITDYEIDTIRYCECDITPITEKIVAGEPVGEVANGGVEGLFDLIAKSLAAGPASMHVDFHPANGAPVRIAVDESENVADDEYTLEVLRLAPSESDDVDLALLLKDLGAAVDSAPEDALTLGDARYCGLDSVGFDPLASGNDPIARTCFTFGAQTAVPSLLVQVQPTVEGDPIVSVFRAKATGEVVVYSDSSQDAFGSGGWTTRTCSGTSVDSSEIGGINC